MNDMSQGAGVSAQTILVVENNVLERAAVSEYLRHCGYKVVEAASAYEAMVLLNVPHIALDVVFTGAEMPGDMNGFALAAWVREHKPGLDVILAGDIIKAAEKAGDLCEEGPHLKKPYAPEVLVDWIKRLRAGRKS